MITSNSVSLESFKLLLLSIIITSSMSKTIFYVERTLSRPESVCEFPGLDRVNRFLVLNVSPTIILQEEATYDS